MVTKTHERRQEIILQVWYIDEKMEKMPRTTNQVTAFI